MVLLLCVLLVEILDKLCSGMVLVGLLMYLHLDGIMALMIVYEGLGLLIARDAY